MNEMKATVIQAIVFDLDDTIYPEVQFVFSGYRAVAETVRRETGLEIYEDLVDLFNQGQRGDLFTPVLNRYRDQAIEEEAVLKLVQIYRQHQPDIEPFPEARQILHSLSLQFSLGLISDGYLAVQNNKFCALNIQTFFSSVVFSDRWGREFWKPHPRPYEFCAESIGCPVENIVYVGDNPAKDFVTARKLGAKTVRVIRMGTLHSNERLSAEFEADYEIADLSELPHVVSGANLK